MSRARATALALVNWKGVFYERYLLHRHVTALEGANGAGKTTVMIAAYVVLLPDMSRLRFTNLGETGATGGDKGIWGRLGESGRPSFAALDIQLPHGERLVIGVELQRKAEPSVEPSPFMITALAAEIRLQDLLLLRRDGHDEVPDLRELKHNATRLGAECQIFSSTKDYLAALFERGITPLKLSSEEERRKFNEMLRTSMTGGISRALTSELRSFLLKEETGLSDTLSHMRKNLDACQRTRVEVAEAQRLHHEIGGVHAAAERMLAAALDATRLHREESERLHEAAATEVERERGALANLDAGIEATRERHALALARVGELRSAFEQARAEPARLLRSRELAARLAEQCQALAAKDRERLVAAEARERAAEERAEYARRRDRARDDYERSTRGVAHLQTGLEELHRHAHAYRAAQARLDEARALVGDPELGADQAGERLEAAQREKARIDDARLALDRESELDAARRREHAAALHALERIDPEGAGDALSRARAALARLDALERQSAARTQLEAELAQARAAATQQRAIQDRLQALAAPTTVDPSWVEQELARCEAELTRWNEQRRGATAVIEEQQLVLPRCEKRLLELDAHAEELRLVNALLCRVAGRERDAAWTYEAALELQERLLGERESLRIRESELERERSAAERRRAELETESGSVDPALLELRDELDAELLASRYDELQPVEAARMQARLGELSRALVVRDPEAAARSLAGQERALASVWFVNADFLPPAAIETTERDVIVQEEHGLRITRLPVRPTLGRAARRSRAAELGIEAERLAAELDALAPRLRRLDADLSELRALLGRPRAFATEDVTRESAEVRERRSAAERALEQARAELEAADRQSLGLAERVRELRRVLPDASLLDGTDRAQRAQTLATELEAAKQASRELARLAEPRAELRALLDALRTPPATADAGELRAAERRRLDAERDRWFSATEALAGVVRERAALEWANSERALAEHSGLLPALEEQQQLSRRALQEAEAAFDRAQASWEAATAAWQKLDGEWAALEAVREQQALALEREGVSDDSDAALAELERAEQEEGLNLERAELEERASSTEIAVAGERRQRLISAVRQAELARTAAESRVELARREHTELVASLPAPAREHSRLELAAAVTATAPAAWAETRTQRELLLERAAAARHGSELAEALEKAFQGSGEAPARATVLAWLAARDWLRRRIPAAIADAPDPLEGLERLRDHLAALARRLDRQERDLRAGTEDIARGIEAQLRRARNQVRRLDQNLTGVSFGSIQAIRVRMQRVERMDQILTALRQGAAQEFLFQRALPIEEALNELFRRYGGGRGGGHRLLDYREYVELQVEVRRRGNDEFEPANATRLSTGEAIGVGAALMMVVLTEWERDANLFRGRREQGCLRFLFLDEANRLSHDNLATLFDLCRTLDLQLLIAAPEVAHAEGNTTYRLVRTVTADGREEVIVSGRRSTVDAAELAGRADPALLVP